MAPRLVAAACPQCGAGLSVGPGMDRVTCRHCQLTSFVHIPGRAEPPPPPPMPGVHYGHINLAVDPNAASLAIGKAAIVSVIVGIVGMVVVIGGVSVAIFANAPKLPKPPQVAVEAEADDEDARPASAATSKVPRVRAADMKKVELSSLFAQAYELAKKEDAQAVPTSFTAFRVEGGVVDLTSDAYVSMAFEYAYKDPKKRAGEDGVSGRISVRASKGELDVDHSPGHGSLHRVFTPPTCTSTDLWTVVVASGVPSNALATVHLYPDGARGTSPTAWSVRVDGHDEYRREVDAKTCKMLRDWSKKR